MSKASEKMLLRMLLNGKRNFFYIDNMWQCEDVYVNGSKSGKRWVGCQNEKDIKSLIAQGVVVEDSFGNLIRKK